MAAIAGLFCPKKFVAINASNNVRLAAISGGGTVAAYAVSNAPAAAVACALAAPAWVAVSVIHDK